MQNRNIGNLTVSAIGYGCMGLSHAYGEPTDEQTAVQTIRTAFHTGYTFFDTAEIYGTPENPHHNENIVGQALKPYRNKVVIATKFGISFDEAVTSDPKPLVPDSRPEKIRASVEGSLKRLQTDHIDLYYQHRADPKIPVEDVAGTISDLIKEGKILHWGLSEAGEDYIRRAHKICPLAAIQNRYHMMYRNYESLFPALEELNIGFVAFSPLANGLLSGRYGPDSSFNEQGDYRAAMAQFKPEAYEQNKNLLDLLQKLATEKSATPAQISLAWMINKKPYIIPIPGSRKPERLAENAAAANIILTAQEVAQIDTALDNMKISAVFGGSSVK